MYEDENYNLPEEKVVYEEISQEPLIQPENEERPPLAEAGENPIPTRRSEPAPVQQPVRAGYTAEQQDRNFAELRRMHEQNARELELIRRENDQLRQMATQKPVKDDIGIASDAFVERAHVEKIVENRLREQEERYIKQLQAQRRQEEERTLTIQYKDLYSVLTPENLRRFEQEEPELAASIASNPDTYSAKIAAYKQIKKLGIVEENYNEQRVTERLAQNALRPKSPAALAPKQGSQSLAAVTAKHPGYEDSISEDMAARYRKEMEEAISRM